MLVKLLMCVCCKGGIVSLQCPRMQADVIAPFMMDLLI